MGSEHGQVRRKKGVVYSKETNEIVDCLFCRIVREQMPENQLWYKDDLCAVFIPRAPAARLHLLVVPIEHIQNARSLTEKHRPLLEHMKKVRNITKESFSLDLFGFFLLLGCTRTTSCSFSTYGFNQVSVVVSCSTTI